MRSVLAVSLVCAVGLAGCTLLAPRHDASRFYTLAPHAPAPSAAVAHDGLSVVIGPVTLPSYLDRNEVAVRVSPSELKYALDARWAEPLAQNFTQVLVEDLGNALASDRVASITTAPTVTPDFFVEVVVVRFEAGVDGSAQLTVRWAVRDTERKILRVRQSQHSRQATVATTEGGVNALSATVGDLADEMAATLHELRAERR